MVTSGFTKMAGHSFPVSLGLPRWRPCQIPDPGEGTLSKFPVGSPPPSPTLRLNIDRCISRTKREYTSTETYSFKGICFCGRNWICICALLMMTMVL